MTIDRSGFDDLLTAIAGRGFEVIGPTVRDGAIVYGEVASSADMPVGMTDEQDGGTYRLHERDDDALFGYAVGPQSWKRYLHPPEVKLWRAARSEDGSLAISEADDDPPAYAFIGVRSCELHAIAIQDRVMTGGDYPDPFYAARREGAFIVAVNCTVAGGTCFCVSMDTGPRAENGYDIALTEVIDGDAHYFVCDAGTERGAEIVAELPTGAAGPAEVEAADAGVARAAANQGRVMETEGIKELLYANLEHPRWDEVSERCLTCGNCTMVCPTCFCTTVEDEQRPRREHRRADEALGLLLHDGFLLRPRRQRPRLGAVPLPAVDDPQARHLDRPVRNFRLRRLRALHHLVPGGDRHHRGGGGDPCRCDPLNRS